MKKAKEKKKKITWFHWFIANLWHSMAKEYCVDGKLFYLPYKRKSLPWFMRLSEENSNKAIKRSYRWAWKNNGAYSIGDYEFHPEAWRWSGDPIAKIWVLQNYYNFFQHLFKIRLKEEK